MILYDYFRSSAAYRVRLALELKNMKLERRPIHLVRGEQHTENYLSKNPLGLVPALELDDGSIITQSLAIIEYLDSLYPTPRLIPDEPLLAAKSRAVSYAIACDTHPLINLRVCAYLTERFGESSADVDAWRRNWIHEGLGAVERMIEPGPYCFGARPTLADICLIPQVFSARRFSTPLDGFPKILSVDAACAKLPAFAAAQPSAQADVD
jgi:maleylacetoacetate isomerase